MNPQVLIVEDDPRDKDALDSAIFRAITAMGQSAQSDIASLLDFFEDLRWLIYKQLVYVLTPLIEQQGKLSKSALLEQLKCKNKIKALHKPILSIPQSLRPIEFIAR